MTVFCIKRADPRGLDRLGVDAVALPFFEVCAQPRGAAGSADWRLAGRLGRMIQSARFTGARDENVLMPTMGRFDAKRIFLIGLGDPEKVQLVTRLTKAATILFEAGAKDVAVAPPTPGTTGDVTAAGVWIEAIRNSGQAFERITLLDSDGALVAGQAEIAERCRSAKMTFDAKGQGAA